jgi:alpha-tubulin suppressor-like RCC1 family protein
VTLTLSYDPGKLPAGVPAGALQLVTSDGTGWVPVPNGTVDSVANTVSAPISHFSTYNLALSANTVSGALAPTSLTVGQTTVLTSQAWGYQTSPITKCGYDYHYFPPLYSCQTTSTTTFWPIIGNAIYWSSSAPGVASVAAGPTYTGSNGAAQSPTIAGVGAGTAQIYATLPCPSDCQFLKSSLPITVQAIPPTPSNDLAASCGHVITGIAFDGVNYYVGEGHDAGTQCITRFTATGGVIDYKQFPVDIRGLTYVPALGKLVSRTYNGPLYVIDYQAGTADQLTSFNPTPDAWGYQVQPAADPDGLTFWIVNPTTSRAEQHRLSDNGMVASFPVTGGSPLAPAVAASNHFIYVPNGLTLNRYDKATGALESSRQLSASSYGCYGGLYLFARASYGFGASAADDKVMYDASCSRARVEAMGASYTHLSFGSLSAGAGHVCGLHASGVPYCWGLNDAGQIGNGATADVHTPAMALGGPTTDGSPQIVPMRSISAGQGYTCGLNGFAAYCWGANDYGQLGNGSTASTSSPGVVTTNVGFAQVAVGPYHACALTPAGAAYCWGRNDYGQLGNGTQTGSATVTPVAVAGGHVFSTIAAEELTTCGLSTDQTVWCWGNDYDGRLGDGGSDGQNVPVQVHSPVALVSLAAGLHHACGLDASGVAYCWGSGNEGELGNGAIGAARVPTAIAGLQFRSISPGAFHSCGIATSGESYCWGFNGSGELGDGTNTTSLSPVLTAGGLTWTALSAGTSTCGIATDGVTYCWGPNTNGELGNGSTIASGHPLRVAGQ